jgi:hypothetical protein
VQGDNNVLVAARLALSIDDFKLDHEINKSDKGRIKAIDFASKSLLNLSDKEIEPIINDSLVPDKFSDHKWLIVKGLHVHHKYYKDDLRLTPWAYPDDAYIIYCEKCHEEHHRNVKIPRLNSEGKQIGLISPQFETPM